MPIFDMPIFDQNGVGPLYIPGPPLMFTDMNAVMSDPAHNISIKFDEHVVQFYQTFVNMKCTESPGWVNAFYSELESWEILFKHYRISQEQFERAKLIGFQMRRLLMLAAEYLETGSAAPSYCYGLTMKDMERNFTPHIQGYGRGVVAYNPYATGLVINSFDILIDRC